MVGNKSVSFIKKSITYSFLYIYLGIVMFTLSYFIYMGPRVKEPIALIILGFALGAGFTMIGTGVITIIPFLVRALQPQPLAVGCKSIVMQCLTDFWGAQI